MKSLKILVAVALFAACSPNNPKRQPPPEVNAVMQIDPGAMEVAAESKVDILFVVDDSRSMRKHQENLSNEIKKFSQEFEKNALVDFHIGVTTAYDSRLKRDNPNLPFEQSTWNGRKIDITPLGHLVPLKDGETGAALTGPRYITKETPNFVKVLEKTLLVGAKPGPDDRDAPTIGPYTEEFFNPARYVFEAPYVNGINQGFYRPDAFLVIFFITDANDESVQNSPDQLYEFLTSLKYGDSSRVQSYAAIIPSNAKTGEQCKRDASGRPIAIERFLDKFTDREHRILNLCSKNFGTKLAQFGRDITEKMPEKIIEIPVVPDQGSIKVYYGSQLLKEGQHYSYISGTRRKSADGIVRNEKHRVVMFRKLDVKVEKGAKLRVEFIRARDENLENGRLRVI